MTNSSLIRRVVGLPGDTVYVKDYIVYIKPGDQVLGVRVIGIPPIPIGFDHEKGTVFLPYTTFDVIVRTESVWIAFL